MTFSFNSLAEMVTHACV